MFDPNALTCDYMIILFRKLIETAILWTFTVHLYLQHAWYVPVIWICSLVNHCEVALVLENCYIFYKIRGTILLKIQEKKLEEAGWPTNYSSDLF